MLVCFSITGSRPELSKLKNDIVNTISGAASQPKKWYNYLSHLDLTVEDGSLTTTFKLANGEPFAFLTLVNEELVVTLMGQTDTKTNTLALSATKGLIKSCIFVSNLQYTIEEKNRISN